MAEVMAPPGPPGDEGESADRGARIIALLGRRGDRGAGASVKVPGYVISPGAKIGEGRFSDVYRARDPELARDVAIKILRAAGPHSDRVQQARMENEARALARLQGTRAGDHVIQIYGRSRSTEDPPYLVLEYLEGGSLQDLLREHGPMEARGAASMARTIAEVVHAFHEQGIIHRDLKPSNILLTRDQQPKLADFGLARFDAHREGWTFEGQILGTPEYMAPEQATGRSVEVGPPSDLYSIGAILYACLTGRPPFQAPDIEETLAIIRSDVEPVAPERLVPSVPRDLSTICLKSLSKAKAARYASTAELADDLGRFLQGRPILARRAGPIERAAKLIRRNRRISAMIGLVVLSVAVGVVASALYAREAKRQEGLAKQNALLRSQALEVFMKALTADKWRRAGQRTMQVQLFNDLLPQLEAGLQLQGDDPATRFLQGSSWNNLATARREIGKGPEALTAAENAERIFRKLIADGAFVDEASLALATSLASRGPILGQAGQFDLALALLEEAANLLGPRAEGGNPGLHERLAHVHNNWANCLRFGRGGTPEALDGADRHYRAAVDHFGRAAGALTTSRDWQARSLSNLALLDAESRKRPVDGLPTARQAADLARAFFNDRPKDLDSLDCLATCLTNVVEIQMALKPDDLALRPSLIEALSLYERISAQIPDNFDYRWSVAMAHDNLGRSFLVGSTDDLPGAAEHLRRAEVSYRDLVKEAPENQELAGYIARNRALIEELGRRSRPSAP